MSKPFTLLAGVLFLIAAVIHAFRLYSGFSVVIAGYVIPIWASWIFLAVAVVIGSMLLREARQSH